MAIHFYEELAQQWAYTGRVTGQFTGYPNSTKSTIFCSPVLFVASSKSDHMLSYSLSRGTICAFWLITKQQKSD